MTSPENFGRQFHTNDEIPEDRPVYTDHTAALKLLVNDSAKKLSTENKGLTSAERQWLNGNVNDFHDHLDQSEAAHKQGDFALARSHFRNAHEKLDELHFQSNGKEPISNPLGAEGSSKPFSHALSYADNMLTHLNYNLYRNMPKDYGDSVGRR